MRRFPDPSFVETTRASLPALIPFVLFVGALVALLVSALARLTKGPGV